jgi:RNA recognition motif-containing protein
MKPTAEALFVANLPYEFTDDQLAELFDPFGLVITFRIARDRTTGQSKGFGFVELATEKARKKAIDAVNGKVISGRTLEVRMADVPAKPVRRPRRLAAPPAAAASVAARTAANRKVLVEYRKLSERRLRAS